jgi:hypothetical protein
MPQKLGRLATDALPKRVHPLAQKLLLRLACPQIPRYVSSVQVVHDVEALPRRLVCPVVVIKALTVPDKPETYGASFDAADQDL